MASAIRVVSALSATSTIEIWPRRSVCDNKFGDSVENKRTGLSFETEGECLYNWLKVFKEDI
jgi:hypothetical protein